MTVSRFVHVGLFSVSASVGMVFALLAELQDEHGLSTSSLGLIASMSFFAAVVGQIGIAPLADRGHARTVMVVAVLTAAVAAGGFMVATSAWQFVVARGVAGLAYGAFSPAAQAVVSAADPARAGQRLGSLVGVQTAGFIIGPGIGVAILDITGSTDAPFLVLLVLLLAITPRLATMSINEVSRNTQRVPVRVILARRDALAAVILTAALVSPAGLYEAIWARYLTDLGASTLFIGGSLTLYGIPFVLAAPYGGKLADRIGPLRLAPISFVVIIPLTAVYGTIATPGALMSLAMIEAVANGAGMPAAQSLMASATSETERATGLGVAAAAGQVGAGLSALVAAPLYDAQGSGVTFMIFAVVIGVLGALGLAVGFSAGVARRNVPAHIPRRLRIRGGGR
jgi:MFS family permease